MYMYVVVCYKHVLEDTDCYGGYLNKSCILYNFLGRGGGGKGGGGGKK